MELFLPKHDTKAPKHGNLSIKNTGNSFGYQPSVGMWPNWSWNQAGTQLILEQTKVLFHIVQM